jgi:hypothetical protein
VVALFSRLKSMTMMQNLEQYLDACLASRPLLQKL